MSNLLIAAGAALVFAVWLRLWWFVPVRDGLAVAGALFLIYIVIEAYAS